MSILQLLRSDGSIVINKFLARTLGLHEAIVLSELVSWHMYYADRNQLDDENMFFCTVEKLEENTTLSRHLQANAINRLKELRLITHASKGMPARRFFSINENEIAELVNNKILKSLTSSCEKYGDHDVHKSASNNTNNNTNISTTTTINPNPDIDILNLIQNVEYHFVRQRGKGLNASTNDYLEMSSLIKHGIPPEFINKVVTACFKEYKPKHSRDVLRNFSYCVPRIFDEWHKHISLKDGGQVGGAQSESSGSTNVKKRNTANATKEGFMEVGKGQFFKKGYGDHSGKGTNVCSDDELDEIQRLQQTSMQHM